MNTRKPLALIALLAAPLLCAAATWKDVSIVDSDCAVKVKDNPDAHTRSCAQQCAKSGYGILTTDGKFLKFDTAGNDKAVAALQGSKASDHLRATVTGDLKGDTIQVKSVKM